MFLTNPYTYGNLITDPALFFGRAEELERINDRLRKGNSTSVVGLRRMGKSSLLYQLAHQTQRLPDGVWPVYLDLQEAAHHQPLGLLNAAWAGWQPQSARPVESLADFTARVKQLRGQGYRPVMCLDEVEELTERPAFNDDFFDGLRALGSQGHLAFVTASNDPLDTLIQQSGRSSRFYNIFTQLNLGGLDDPAARALLTEPFHRADLPPPTPEAVEKTLVLAGPYPFYLQMAAYHLFEQLKNGGPFNPYELRLAFTQEAQRHFLGLWRSLGQEQQAGLKRLVGAPGGVVRNWEQTQTDLRQAGLLVGPPTQPRLFSTALAELVENGWLEREAYPAAAPPPELKPTPPATPPPASPAPPPEPAAPLKTPPLYAYALVALAAAIIALFIALLLPPERFWAFVVIFTVVLTFVLVGVDKLTGGQFLAWLAKLVGK